jgi:hypothetical protein
MGATGSTSPLRTAAASSATESSWEGLMSTFFTQNEGPNALGVIGYTATDAHFQ